MSAAYADILRRLGYRGRNVFVLQVGACDGVQADELGPFLREFGWGALLLEPIPDIFERLQQTYSAFPNVLLDNVAIWAEAGSATMGRIDLSAVDKKLVPSWALGVSSLYPDRNAIGGVGVDVSVFEALRPHVSAQDVTCSRLDTVLGKHRVHKIDILHVSVSGAEWQVIQQFDFGRYLPQIIYYEHCNLPNDERVQLQDRLLLFGYDVMYVGNRALATRIPANVEGVPDDVCLSVGFFTDSKWAFGAIHTELCNELRRFNIIGEIVDYSVSYPLVEFRQRASQFDLFVANPGAARSLLTYGIPKERIALMSHGELDIIPFIQTNGAEDFANYSSFSVVSESLFSSALTLGIRVPDAILPLGISAKRFQCDLPTSLRVVGYAGALARPSAFGVEIKRGALVKAAAEMAGVAFAPAVNIDFRDMPEYYANVDAVVMSSIQEGAGLPVLEGAAAGRLVIGTPVGHFPRLAYEGGGILAPLDGSEFVEFVARKLDFFKNDVEAFLTQCDQGRRTARLYDWEYVAPRWAAYLWDVATNTNRRSS